MREFGRQLETFAAVMFGCVIAACLVGIALDLVFAFVSPIYFSYDWEEPVSLALKWGVAAAWWLGLIAGVMLGLVNHLRRIKLAPWTILKKVFVGCGLLWAIGMIVLGVSYLAYGYEQVNGELLPDFMRRFCAVEIAVNVSYDLSYVLIIILSVWIWTRPNPNSIEPDLSVSQSD